MMRINRAARWAAFACIGMWPLVAAHAQNLTPADRAAQPSTVAARDASVQGRVRRPVTRVPIYPRRDEDGVYPRYNPGPNAVRDCTATYVQELRPSGPVITPRLNCYWRRG